MEIPQTTRDSASPHLLLIALAYLGFVSLGLPDSIIGVAWPSVRDRFGLHQATVGYFFIASSTGYFVSSFVSGRLTQSLGIGLLLAVSTGLVAASMFGLAVAPMWALFVACGVLHGLGSGAIDAGLNGYVAHSLSARHMNWLHACYCLGAMLGPLVMTAVLTGGRSYAVGYALVGSVMATLGVLFLGTRPRWGTARVSEDHPQGAVSSWEALRHPDVLISMALFFMYTGVEVAFAQWTYTVLTESRAIPHSIAGVAVGFFWGCLGSGRVIFGFLAESIGLDRVVRGSLTATVIGAVLYALPLGGVGAYAGLALAGIGLAPVFPCLMTRTPQRLGTRLSAHAIGFQVGSAMIGAAAVPGLMGVVAERFGLPRVPLGIVAAACLLWLLHEILLRRTSRSMTPVELEAGELAGSVGPAAHT